MRDRVFYKTNGKHAPFNEDRPELYDADAAADAWAKTVAFFCRELKA